MGELVPNIERGENSDDVRSRVVSRRAALQLAAGAGAAVAAAPLLARAGNTADLFDLRDAVPALAARPNWPAPPIVTRAQWGANESLRKPGRIYNSKVTKIVVHHTGTPNDITDYPGLVRGIFTNELNNGYIDVAYNWLIDPNGRIYEGRWARNYPAGATHTGESDSRNVQGAHALHFNVDTIGIGLMGDYSAVAPSSAMVAALIRLLSWKCARWGIDPLGAVPYVNSEGARITGLANICGHRDTYATACPGSTVEAMLPELRRNVAARVAIGPTGYWITSSVGQLLAFGNLPNDGGTGGLHLSEPIIGMGGHPLGTGYWLFARDGGVFTFGSARFHGSTGAQRLNQPMVGMAPTRNGNGYWLVARDGGVFSFGDAQFHGSTGGLRLNSPVLGLTPTPTGRGYWLYARDGGIFSFGDAKFFGSTGGIHLNQPIVGMAARPQNDGYWMVAADGGIFTFGKAPFLGSGASRPRSAPCVAMTPSTTGRGYALLFADGSVAMFGDAPYLGGAAGRLAGPAVGFAGRLSPLG
jgi:N-acetylmuramoyl-L-alanine amidase